MKGKWQSSSQFRLVTPQNYFAKSRYYERIVRESLEINMAIFKYKNNKALDKDNRNFVKTNAWKPLLKKMKTFLRNWTSFCLKWRFCVVNSSV